MDKIVSKDIKTIAILLALILIYGLLIDPILEDSLLLEPVTRLQAKAVYLLQVAWGLPVAVFESSLFYTDLELQVNLIPLCVAFREVIIFLIVALIARTKPIKEIAFPLLAFVALILIENLLRIASLYHIARIWEFSGMYALHDFIWNFGQAVFLGVIVLVWLILFSGLIKKDHKD